MMLTTILRRRASLQTGTTRSSNGTTKTSRSLRFTYEARLLVITRMAPGRSSAMSSATDSTFIATKTSASRLRAVQPSPLARTVNQVGSPWMFDGNMFFPLTGIPMLKIDRIRMRLADWLPVPLEVATVMVTSLTAGWVCAAARLAGSCVAMVIGRRVFLLARPGGGGIGRARATRASISTGLPGDYGGGSLPNPGLLGQTWKRTLGHSADSPRAMP